MAQRVPIEQAALNALATWLVSQLPNDVIVSKRWPEASEKLPPKAVTLLLAGRPTDEPVEPKLVGKVSDNPDGKTAVYRWQVQARTQPVQLDVWATYAPVRDDIKARVEDALRAGPGQTLAGNALGDPAANSLLLALGDGWNGFADFYFDGVDVDDSPDSNQQSEFRATFSGQADVCLYVDATSPRMARITLEQHIGEASPADANPSTSATLSASGAVFSDP